MKIAVDPLSLRLQSNQCVRLHDARGVAVRVTAGVLWITQEGDVVDHILSVGESFPLERHGLTIVSAMSDAEFRIEKRTRRTVQSDVAI